MNKNEINNIVEKNTVSNEEENSLKFNKDLMEVEQFLCYLKLRDEVFPKFSREGINSLKQIINMDENQMEKILTNLDENHAKLLMKNLNILFNSMKDDEQIILDQIFFDLGGGALSKETVVNGFKMKNKLQVQTLSYQNNLEKNSKPENIFVSFLTNKNISRMTSLEIFKNMKHLYLSDNKIQKITNLENLVNLNILDLKGNYIRKIEGLDSLIQLQNLNLESNLIDKLENLTNNFNLITLNVSQQIIPKEKIFLIDETSLPFDSRIQTINLENNNINDPRNLKIFKNTQILKLKNNKIEELNYLLEAIKEMPFLENLNFLNNPMKEAMKSCRDIIIIYGQNLNEINEKNVTNNERSFLNSFYSRKANQNKSKNKPKQDNLSLDIVKIEKNNKNDAFPLVKNYKYYSYK